MQEIQENESRAAENEVNNEKRCGKYSRVVCTSGGLAKRVWNLCACVKNIAGRVARTVHSLYACIFETIFANVAIVFCHFRYYSRKSVLNASHKHEV